MTSSAHDNTRAEALLTRAERAARGVRNVLRTRYPRFLLGLPLARGEIPVFIYHDVTPADLARDLEFLRVNGYRTLGLDEFLANSGATPRRGERRVLLTFDDARRSFYEAALPVLRTFEARATLFVPSYWMGPPSITGTDLFMSWAQVRACLESNLVDVQFHSHRHALVYTSDRLIGFAHPSLLTRYDIYDWPMRREAWDHGRRPGHRNRLGPPALGAPIYRAAPLLSAEARFLESAGLTEACVRFVERNGAEEFFSRSNWASSLRRLHESRSAVLRGDLMSPQELRTLLASEFDLGRAEFLAHLGYAPTSIAYPWVLGSRRSLEVAGQFGLRTAFGVAVDYRRAREPSLPVRVFGRLKADWLPLLPGKGRASFLTLAARKIAAFSRIQPLAH